jgi:hypothetical protein
MKVRTENDNNFGYEKITILVDNIPLIDVHVHLTAFYSASSLKQQSSDRHVAPLGHIILMPSQPVFALSP